MVKCPKCGSKDIRIQSYMGIKILKCSNCGFDESMLYDLYPEEKKSQKAKGKYTVYKTGGSQRTRRHK